MMSRVLPPSRARRTAKRIGLATCVVIAAMWAVSTTYTVARFGPSSQADCVYGAVRVNWHPKRLDLGPRRPRWFAQRMPFAYGLKLPELRSLSRDHVSFTMPFWCLLVIAAAPTVALWMRDRRTAEPGCCRLCGYDLRASKRVCPECGAAIFPPATSR